MAPRPISLMLPLLIVCGLLLGGCYSRLTGPRDQLTFAYETVQDIENFHKAIAVGARLDLRVVAAGAEEEVEIVEVRARSKGVLRVVEAAANRIVVEALRPGSAVLMVRARDPYGHELRDRVRLRVDRPAQMVLGHGCAPGPYAAYPAGLQDVAFAMDLERIDGRPAVGYGLAPVEVEPPGAARVRPAEVEGELRLDLLGPPGELRLRSTLGDDALLVLRTVETPQIDEARLDDDFFDPRLLVGERTFLFFDPYVEGTPLCHGELLTRARSLTPEICGARSSLDGGADQEDNRSGLVVVEGLGFGICEIEVSFPEIRGGRGHTRRLRMAIGELPALDEAVAPPCEPAEEPRRPWPWWLAPLLAMLAPALVAPWLIRRRE